MNTLTLIIVFGLLGLVLFESYFTSVFIKSFSQNKRELYEENELPKVAIALCLRGADPFLSDCLQALLNQNYPQYELKIVVDSERDPAWKIAMENLQHQTAIPVQISPLRVRRETCSLKCSALIQAISELDADCEIIALIDADTIPHVNWLRELVSPLKDPKIGLTTGNRWYVPGKQWGTLCRYLWNIAAVGQMNLYRIPWGGTLAIKTEIVRQARLLEKWKQAFGEDTMLCRVLQEEGIQIESVAALMMVNREECTLPNFRRWVSRQLLTAKLYHPGWRAILIYGTITCLIPATTALSTLIALFAGQGFSAVVLTTSLFIYIIVLLGLISVYERAIRQKLALRNERLPDYSARDLLRFMLAIPLTQLVCAIALWQAMLTQQVEWRGITYQIKGPWDIKLLEYFPYQYLNRTNPKTSL
ncbi:glycosyltransferase family 2 protein [Pleurocapsales cyanobacterium LEGE 10410]|nr:glycosyltransferase family 2 protein [Pleurocapsales cyanobacterium LEGE 10410]